MINVLISESGAFCFIEIAVGSNTIIASFSFVGPDIKDIIEPSNQLLRGFANRVCADNAHHANEQAKNHELEGLELVKSNTSLTVIDNAGFSILNHLPNNAVEDE